MRKGLSIIRTEERYFGIRYQAFISSEELDYVKHSTMCEPLYAVHRVMKTRIREYTRKTKKVWP